MAFNPVLLLRGGWLFYVQHQFQGVCRARHEQWASGNIGYHHLHHACPGILNYNLPACHRPIPVLAAVPSLSLRASLGCLKLKLYNEQTRQMVGS